MYRPRTMYRKIWDAHVAHAEPGKPDLLYVDLHLIHELHPHEFDALREAGRRVRRPDLTVATVDHNVPTTDRSLPIADDMARAQIDAMERNSAEFGVEFHGLNDPGQGIVHVIGPEAGLHPARHGDRLRRQPHLDARRLRRARLRHRLVAGRARPGIAVHPADAVAGDGDSRRGNAGTRRHAQGPDPRHHRRDRHRRRDGPRDRVHRLGHPQPLDGGPHDRLQHVDRGRGPRRYDRPRRDHVRLPGRQAARPPGRRLRRGRRTLARAPQRRGRSLRPEGRDRRVGPRALCHVGAPTPA